MSVIEPVLDQPGVIGFKLTDLCYFINRSRRLTSFVHFISWHFPHHVCGIRSVFPRQALHDHLIIIGTFLECDD